jgi:hypothetical protein
MLAAWPWGPIRPFDHVFDTTSTPSYDGRYPELAISLGG